MLIILPLLELKILAYRIAKELKKEKKILGVRLTNKLELPSTKRFDALNY